MRLTLKQMLFTGLALSLPLSCLAGTMGEVGNYKRWSIPLQAGFFVAFQGRGQDVEIASFIGNYTLPDYAFRGATKTNFISTAGIALRVNNLLGQGSLAKNTDPLLNTLNTGDTYTNAPVYSVSV